MDSSVKNADRPLYAMSGRSEAWSSHSTVINRPAIGAMVTDDMRRREMDSVLVRPDPTRLLDHIAAKAIKKLLAGWRAIHLRI